MIVYVYKYAAKDHEVRPRVQEGQKRDAILASRRRMAERLRNFQKI